MINPGFRAVVESNSDRIGLINLVVKCAGARSEGNLHAACEVAGAGNGATDTVNRARRGKPRIQPSQVLTGHRASSRPDGLLSPGIRHSGTIPSGQGGLPDAGVCRGRGRPCHRDGLRSGQLAHRSRLTRDDTTLGTVFYMSLSLSGSVLELSLVHGRCLVHHPTQNPSLLTKCVPSSRVL